MILNVRQLDKNRPGFWQHTLQENYQMFEHWEHWSEIYGLAARLGFDTPKEAWDYNPLIQGSVYPEDFSIVSA